jgi:hypothetical protein
VASGDSAAEEAAAARARAAKYRLRADRAERTAGAWGRGAEGETALAAVMAPLAADGYYVLGDRRFPESAANIDHLLVGPAGIFVVDAKSWTGDVRLEGKSLRQNGRRRDEHIERLRTQAVGVAAVMEDGIGEHRTPVRPVMCFVEGAEIERRTAVDRVHVLNSGDLVPFVRSLARVLDQQAIDDVMRCLLERLPARTAPVKPPPAPAQPAPEPEELLVFLQPWSKYGKRRLYVKAVDGAEIGHLNVATGEVHATDDQWKHVLARLLPHFISDAASGQNEQLSNEARGAFRRFLDLVLWRQQQTLTPAPLLAAYHWRNYGKDRLYVHRIDTAGAKREVGWVDLDAGVVRPADPATQLVLLFCRDRFRSFSAA